MIDKTFLVGYRRLLVFAGALIGVGLGLAFVFLPTDWSATRKALAGLLGGGGVSLFIAASRLSGAYSKEDPPPKEPHDP